jgi:predicted nucleic acid-binding protein
MAVNVQAGSDDQAGDQASGSSIGQPSRLGGLYDGFDAYRTPTDADYSALFKSGMIVLDANVLIDLYKYHKKTRDEFLLVLDTLKERIWLPHQVIKEFWKNRDNVLRDPREVDKTARELAKDAATADRVLRTWAKLVRLPQDRTESLIKTLANSFDETIGKVRELGVDDGREFARDTNNDPLLLALEPILNTRVGAEFDSDEQAPVIAEAQRRGKERIPPGYMDVGKEGAGPTGDYVLWAQVLKESQRKHHDVLFVTSDNKEDWWRKDKDDESLGPRPELVEELKGVAGARLFMLPPDSLLDRAGVVLRLPVSEESVQDVKQISSRRFEPGIAPDDEQDQLRGAVSRVLSTMMSLNSRQPSARTSTTLFRYVESLVDALFQPALQPLLDAVWVLLAEADHASSNPSIFGKAVWQPSDAEREVWVALDALRTVAIQAGLEGAADSHIERHGDHLDAPFDYVQLPPGVLAADAQVYGSQAGSIEGVEFAAVLKDGRRVTTRRAVEPT